MAGMALLADRQATMRALATAINDGTYNRKQALKDVRELREMEEQSADGSRATIARSEHDHVKKSGRAALQNRLQTITFLDACITALQGRDDETASESLLQAAACGGKKSVKAARKAPTVALYVQYLAETDSGFQDWLTSQGIKA